MSKGIDEWTTAIHQGDAFDLLEEMPADSVHAIVTDPPYGLAFMGRDWDDFEPKEYQEWCETWAVKAMRVLKPGGHLLAFSGNRTHHRLFSGVEDAGFEVRDTLTWHYGSGFPKAGDISKTMDKRADADRKVVARQEKTNPATGTDYGNDGVVERTAPATDAAKEWDGWKTGLKPATEFVIMARKPFDGATVDCVQEHGTGALNIGETRIENDIEEVTTTTRTSERNQNAYGKAEQSDIASASPDGRYPSNVVFDEQTADELDQEIGDTGGGTYRPADSSERDSKMFDPSDGWNQHSIDPNNKSAPDNYGGSGGPSRYFYTSKATQAERTLDGKIENAHPTVKPTDLMEWLVKLVTREDQIVLDPFAGSGTTCMAAKELNRRFIGIEMQEKWADVARVRAGLTPRNPAHVRDGEENQQGLEVYTDGGR